MHLDATFYALLALFILLGGLAYVGVHKQIFKALDDRSAGIAKELAEAQRLRTEAERLLGTYAAKQAEAEAEAAATLEQAKRDAEAMTAEAKATLEETIKRRLRLAEERISRAEEQTLAEIRGAATDNAIKAAGEALGAKLDKAGQASLFDQSIKELATKLR